MQLQDPDVQAALAGMSQETRRIVEQGANRLPENQRSEYLSGVVARWNSGKKPEAVTPGTPNLSTPAPHNKRIGHEHKND